MEQHILYSLIYDLFSRNFETYLHKIWERFQKILRKLKKNPCKKTLENFFFRIPYNTALHCDPIHTIPQRLRRLSTVSSLTSRYSVSNYFFRPYYKPTLPPYFHNPIAPEKTEQTCICSRWKAPRTLARRWKAPGLKPKLT